MAVDYLICHSLFFTSYLIQILEVPVHNIKFISLNYWYDMSEKWRLQLRQETSHFVGVAGTTKSLGLYSGVTEWRLFPTVQTPAADGTLTWRQPRFMLACFQVTHGVNDSDSCHFNWRKRCLALAEQESASWMFSVPVFANDHWCQKSGNVCILTLWVSGRSQFSITPSRRLSRWLTWPQPVISATPNHNPN